MIGKVLGNRYEILEEIGSGGMACVYKAKCRLLNRMVAVKVLRPELAQDKEFLARFHTEAQAAAALSHPNIVSVYDVGEEDGLQYIVMEYVEGETLKQYLDKHGMLEWRTALQFALQILSALEHAHKNGIVHRDIKPHNIIITPEKALKVTDFGIARAVTTKTVTVGDTTMGSVHYFSPEQAKGSYTDARSDLYSLGVVLYEMLTGHVPFTSDSPVSIAIKHIQEAPVSPKEYNIAVPLSVEAIVLKAMSKDPAQRYQSAADMTKDIHSVLQSPELVPVPPQEADDSATKKIEKVRLDDTMLAPVQPEHAIPRRGTAQPDKIISKKTVAWSIAAASVLVIALIVGTIAVVFPNAFSVGKRVEMEVPSLVGKIYEEVKDKYKEQSVTIEVIDEVQDPDVEAGRIISQRPDAGINVKTPITIEVIVSLGGGEFRLENYEKKESLETKLALEEKGIKVREIAETSDEIPSGYIIRTSPAANALVQSGDEVILYVSSGAGDKKVTVPKLVGMTLQQARRSLAENKLLEGDTTYEYSSAKEGQVISQSVQQGEEVKEFSSIDLVISQGPSTAASPTPTPSSAPPSVSQTPQVTKSIGVNVPQDRPETTIKVTQDGVVIHNATHKKEEIAFNLDIVGTGTVTIEVYYDGVKSQTRPVTL